MARRTIPGIDKDSHMMYNLVVTKGNTKEVIVMEKIGLSEVVKDISELRDYLLTTNLKETIAKIYSW